MPELPEQFKRPEFRFLRITEHGKKPLGKWEDPTLHLAFDDPKLLEHVAASGNVGILGGYGGLVAIDCDKTELDLHIRNTLPTTLVERSAKGSHFFFVCDDFDSFISLDVGDTHFGELRGDKGHQTVITPSVHESGVQYSITDPAGVARVSKEGLLRAVAPFNSKEQRVRWKGVGNTDKSYPTFPVQNVIDVSQLRPVGNGEFQGPHPIHGSTTGQNFCVNTDKNLWFCFRHNQGGTALHLVAIREGLIDCGDSLEGDNLRRAANLARAKYGYSILRERMRDAIDENTDFIKLAAGVVEDCPVHYDSAGIWWTWTGTRWKMVDDIDILNVVRDSLDWNRVVDSDYATKVLRALRMVARKCAPQAPPREWILTASGIYDIATGEVHEASPKYFFTDYIPWKVGNSEHCETIDRLLQSWVGNRVAQLYELMAYSLYRGYPIQRLFCLLGSGANGKGSFVRLLSRLIGDDNLTSFSLKRLSNDKFQTAKLYKKLVAVATEIDYGIFENTSVIKALVGGDPIPIEFKNKTPFDFFNWAKIIISANSLPATTDQTPGFYRRWLIIEFLNRFDDGKDVVDDVPAWEFQNLLRKLLNLLPTLLANQKFSDEGSWEQKRDMYETRSNPVQLFVQRYCRCDAFGFVPMHTFRDQFVAFAVQNGYRRLSDKEIWGLLGLLGYTRGRQKVTYDNGEEHNIRGIQGLTLSMLPIAGSPDPPNPEHPQNSEPPEPRNPPINSCSLHVEEQYRTHGFDGSAGPDSADPTQPHRLEHTILALFRVYSKSAPEPMPVDVLLAAFEEADQPQVKDAVATMVKKSLLWEPKPGTLLPLQAVAYSPSEAEEEASL